MLRVDFRFIRTSPTMSGRRTRNWSRLAMTNIWSRTERNRSRLLLTVVVCVGALSTVASVRAQTGYRPTAANLAAREWFQDARFGLFVHWGVYSVLGDGE